MRIQCEKDDGTYEMVEYPDYKFVCGEDFCDDCGDCLDCYYHSATDYCNGIGLVFYKDNPKNKLTFLAPNHDTNQNREKETQIPHATL